MHKKSCIICVFWNTALDIFLKILKDKAMHRCDLFSQEELNIENVFTFTIMTGWPAILGYTEDTGVY